MSRDDRVQLWLIGIVFVVGLLTVGFAGALSFAIGAAVLIYLVDSFVPRDNTDT